ncbi:MULTISPECIES: ArsC family reductase [unclassified Roseibium]|uniref:ArsC family reductase n=1 Tax=unclassified Roseibium TaxID=2629323 RepID=UPI003170418C
MCSPTSGAAAGQLAVRDILHHFKRGMSRRSSRFSARFSPNPFFAANGLETGARIGTVPLGTKQMEDPMKVYGIRNCDTVKKARKFLEEAGIPYEFHDYKKDGVDGDRLAAIVDEFGWDAVLNKRGTTWRRLDEATQDGVTDASSALDVMIDNPSVIRRPIVEGAVKNFIGFDPVAWEMALELGELK